MRLIFSVKDLAVQAFQPPFSCRSKGEAIRMISDETNRADPGNIMYNHADDYELYWLGVMDEETGDIAPEKPTLVIRAKELKTIKE